MKRALSAIQRHGNAWSFVLLTSLSIASCGSQATFVAEKPSQKPTSPKSGSTTSGTNSGSNATAANKPGTDASSTPGGSSSSDPAANPGAIPVDPLSVPTPTVDPSAPTVSPTATATPAPTSSGTTSPTASPTAAPTSTAAPTASPTSVPVPVPTPTTTAAPTPSSTPDPSCTTPPQTVVTRLSNTFTNNALNQYIQYKLSQKDCHNNPIPITVNEVRFDVNAHVVTGKSNIPFAAYLISDPANPLASGALQVVMGKDMFGTVSPTRWYYSTTNQVTIPASTYEIYFALDYSCAVIHTMGSNAPYPATESIDSYLAFGNATPQTQALQVSNSQLSGSCR